MSHPPSVVVTRSADDAPALARQLEALGAAVRCVPCIEVCAAGPSAALDALLAAVPQCFLVAFASRYGAQFFAQACRQHPCALPPQAQLMAVGPATAQAVQVALGRKAQWAQQHHGEGLLAAIMAHAQPQDGAILLPRGDQGRNVVYAGLLAHRYRALTAVVYQTRSVVPPRHPPPPLPPGSLVVFTSPSCVVGFLAQLEVPPDAKVCTIGPTTTAACRRAGVHVAKEAYPHTLQGLLQAIGCLLGRPSQSPA